MILTEWLSYLSEQWSDVMMRGLWVSLWATSLLWAIDRWMPSVTASNKSWLWRLYFIKLALVIWLPLSIEIPILPPSPARVSQTLQIPGTIESSVQMESAGSDVVTTSATAILPIYECLFILWAIGVCVIVLHRLLQWRKTRGLLSRATQMQLLPIDTKRQLILIANELKQKMGIRRTPQILLAHGISSPMLTGFWSPKILLPESFSCSFAHEDARMALAHELAHLVRQDLIWNSFVAVVQCLYFFNPLLWLACHRYRMTQESACDAMAIQRAKLNRVDFGKLLIRIANTRPFSGDTAASVAFVRRREFLCLAERLNGMKKSSVARSRKLFATAFVAILVCILLSPLSLGQQKSKPKKPRNTQNGGYSFSTSEPTTSTSETNQPPAAGATASAFSSGEFGSSGSNGASAGTGFPSASGGSTGGGGSGSAFGSAGGFASGSGSGFGFGSASAGATIQTTPQSSGYRYGQNNASPGETFGNFRNQSTSNTNNGVSITRNVQNTEDGKETRVNVLERDREILILEDADGIEITIRSKRKGARRSARIVEAESVRDLEQKDPEAFGLYKKYMQQERVVVPPVPPMKLPEQAGNNPAQEMMRQQIEEMVNGNQLDDVSRARLREMLERLPK